MAQLLYVIALVNFAAIYNLFAYSLTYNSFHFGTFNKRKVHRKRQQSHEFNANCLEESEHKNYLILHFPVLHFQRMHQMTIDAGCREDCLLARAVQGTAVHFREELNVSRE